jgi:ABC-type uncharacterized transport system permease subunit
MNDPIVISMLSLTAFLVASGLLVLGFKDSRRHKIMTRLGYFLFIVGTLSTTLDSVQAGKNPTYMASAVAWATVISWFVWKIEIVGAFTSPIIAVTLMYGIFFGPLNPTPTGVEVGPALKLHIASAIIGQSFAILACGMSLLFLWLDKKLKSRQISDLPVSFPSISTLTKALNLTLWVGFTFITLGLVSGAMYYMSGLVAPEMNILPKVIWAVFVWVWYLSILVLKGILSYRPQRVARMSLVGFLLMAVSWFGLLFVAPWRVP